VEIAVSENAQPPFSWAIEVQGLTKSFGYHPALRGIDLQVGRGERLVIFGPNGAGKTTLVKILSMLVKPSSGNVWLDGVNTRDKPAQVRRKIGLVGHQTFLYDNLTVYENLKFYGQMYGIANLEQRIREVTSWTRLETRWYDRVGTLSHGLQQRASLARAALHRPSIMLLDEPEAGLDPQASTVVNDVMSNAVDDGLTVVMVTHNLERGLELGDSVVILNKGKVVYRAARHDIDTAVFRQVYNQCTETS
jgi:heme exporter protein A